MLSALERALAAAVLAVRRDPSAARAVEQCRDELTEPRPDSQQAALLVGWAHLALDQPTEAWACLRAAIADATDQRLTDRAAFLAGLLGAQRLDALALAGAWRRVSTDLRAVLDRTNFTGDLSAELTDQLIWPDHPDLCSDILPTLVTTFDARSRSLAALTMYALHHADDQPGAAVRAAEQVVRLAHPTYVAAAWLGVAETLVKQGDNAAAATACHEALAADGQYSARLLLGLAEGPEPDVHTQAGTLLGTLQREAGDLASAIATLTTAAHDDDPAALLALAQTHDLAGDAAAAQPIYTKLAEYELSEQYQDAIFNLGLQAKGRRDLPEATRWFRQYIEGGYAAHPLAAAHLGELAYWVGDKQAALHWYQYTLDHTELPMLVEEAEQRIAELLPVPTALEQAALAAAKLAVRRDPSAADAVAACRHDLANDVPDAQRIAFLVGWAYLALDDTASAWEAFRAAASADTDRETLGRAALLAGLISFRFGPEVYGVAAWSRAAAEVTGVLDQVDFTRDLPGQLPDELIWPDHDELRSGQPVLAPLLADFDDSHRSLATLGLYTLHLMRDEDESAARAARQVLAIGHPDFTGAAWLGLAEVLVAAGDKAAAAEACRRSAETAAPGQRPVPAILGVDDGSPADVPTRAMTLLGILQREAGEREPAIRTLTGAAHDRDPEAVFALAQTHQGFGDFAAARDVYLTIAEQDSRVLDQTMYNLGLLAKEGRDLPEAKRWFGAYVEAGYDKAPLAAAHLGELCYWLGDKDGSLHWYGYTLANTKVQELVDEAEQRIAELQG